MEKNVAGPISFFSGLPGMGKSDNDQMELANMAEDFLGLNDEDNTEDTREYGEEDYSESITDQVNDFLDEPDLIKDEVNKVAESIFSDEGQEEQQDDGDDDVSLAYALAKSYKETGILPENFEIPENIDGEMLKNSLYDTVKQSFDVEAELKARGYTEDTLEVSKYIANGMDYRLANEGYKLSRLATIKADTDDKIEAILRYYYSESLSPSSVERQVRGIFEDGEEAKEVERIQAELKSRAEKIFDDEVKRREKAEEEQKKGKENVIKAIRTSNFGDKVLSQKEQEDLINYNYKVVGTIDIRGVKQTVTGIEKDLHEIYNDPVKFARFSRMIKEFKSDFKELKTQAAIDAAENTLEIFNKRRKSTRSGENSTPPRNTQPNNLFGPGDLIGELRF